MSKHNPWILVIATTCIGVGVGSAGADPEPKRVTPHATVEVLDDKTPVEDVISQVRARPPRDGQPGKKDKDPRRDKLERDRPPARVRDDKPDKERNRPTKRERHEIDRDDRRPRRR